MEATQERQISVLEKIFVHSGKILSVRGWDGSNIHEIEIHLPGRDFGKWQSAQSIKCRISAFHYTDYTPAIWNAEDKTCKLYVDTSHDGQGSVWAKSQVAGRDFHYSKVESQKHFPIVDKHLVFVGDQTSVGHFCSLQQLATKNARISGFIKFSDQQTVDAFYKNCSRLPLHAVTGYSALQEQTEHWALNHQTDKENFVFYVVGNNEMVVSLRKLLRTYGFQGGQIKTKGFWH